MNRDDVQRYAGWIVVGLAIGLLVLSFFYPKPAHSQTKPACAVALVLLMDASGSVDMREYEAQRDGTAAALRSPEIARVIEAQPGGVAITVIEWSFEPEQRIDWQIVRTAQDAESLAARLGGLQRTLSGGTYLGNALRMAEEAFGHVPCEAEREIIDVSSDGEADDYIEPAVERLRTRGVTINALVIPDRKYPNLAQFYRDEVTTNGGFVIIADGYEAYGPAIRRKLVLELAAVP